MRIQPGNRFVEQCASERLSFLNYHHLLYFSTVARTGSMAASPGRTHD
jgi:hypothetical protein